MAQPQDVGATIRLRREQLGLSQTKLAARLGVDRGTVIGWEAAEHAPSVESRAKLQSELGGDLDDYRVDGTTPGEDVLGLLQEIRDRLERLEQLQRGDGPESQDGSSPP